MVSDHELTGALSSQQSRSPKTCRENKYSTRTRPAICPGGIVFPFHR